ncbi:MAG: hypothetical protein A2W91_09410 [Bacteroidetes bacterium GWF2_38_335]|nr:MAG: hypothetical protein A2W91_09410 [Bacteroidetes bacterium GWF2_38_335]OFY80814.1 MAG: hypothetical protein A2281_09090 [Bacteroidetes bacterium RIFOXYA12_FULL_38_20]HBS86215.1 hypothetical protein [Bacteroidales bacterium]
MKNVLIPLILISVIFSVITSCKKEKEDEKISDEITIDSLVTDFYTVRAYDTACITVYATGADLEYAWEADHGYITGAGTTIKYAAGECCVGTNTVKCTVSNTTGSVSDTIKINVFSYFDPK